VAVETTWTATFDTLPATSTIARVSHEEPIAASNREPATDANDPFAGQAELSLDRLLDEVQQRNPSLQASLAAWSAAAERYPQVVALDDPMFQTMLAPASFASSSDVQSSYSVGIAQKFPWPGKRALRGQMAQAETNAASLDSQEVQLRLTEATRVAFFDYYLVFRESELNGANVDAVHKFRETANIKYESSLVTQQDVLQADVEIAKLESRRIELQQNQRVAVARINMLLHRAPDFHLPRPPAALAIGGNPYSVESLQQLALERPELAAQASRIQAEQAAVELACKEFYPDFELMGRYDQFWTDREQRPQIGLNVNIPLNQSRRQAAVREATFRLRKMQAEYEQQIDSIRHDVEAGFARLDGSRKMALLYDQKILPAARKNVESANAGYAAGKVDFLRLIQAQRELIELQEKQQEAVAEYFRRRAELERAVGMPIEGTSGRNTGANQGA
jgi:outer membrane protein TolC